MTQESVSGQRGSSVLENVVHPCREDYLLIVVSTITDVQTYILILYNYKWILEICGSGISFSQGVEIGSLAKVDNTTATLLYATLLLPICCKMVVSRRC